MHRKIRYDKNKEKIEDIEQLIKAENPFYRLKEVRNTLEGDELVFEMDLETLARKVLELEQRINAITKALNLRV
ncbi:hypothetical protein [Geoglobus ahangari]